MLYPETMTVHEGKFSTFCGRGRLALGVMAE